MAVKRTTDELIDKYSLVHFTGTDLSIIDMLTLVKEEGTLEADRIMVMLCESGRISMLINGKRRAIKSADILICPPGVTFGSFRCSKDANMKTLAMSYAKLRRSFYSGRNFWAVMTYAKNNPIFHLSEKDMKLTLAYYNVISLKIDTKRDFYYSEIIQSLLECAILEISVIINRGIAPDADDVKMKRHDQIFKQFTELLVTGDCSERSVSYYAEKLCITPKYLSAVCSEMTGKPALTLILDHVTSAIEHSLLYSDKSIKEIAMDMNFSDVSSFGKFVRSRLGMSPRDFRRRGGN